MNGVGTVKSKLHYPCDKKQDRLPQASTHYLAAISPDAKTSVFDTKWVVSVRSRPLGAQSSVYKCALTALEVTVFCEESVS